MSGIFFTGPGKNDRPARHVCRKRPDPVVHFGCGPTLPPQAVLGLG